MHSSGVTLQAYTTATATATARFPISKFGKCISHIIRHARMHSCRRGEHSVRMRVCRCPVISQREGSAAAPARCSRPNCVPSLKGGRSLLRSGVCRVSGSESQQVIQSRPRTLAHLVCWLLVCSPITTLRNLFTTLDGCRLSNSLRSFSKLCPSAMCK